MSATATCAAAPSISVKTTRDIGLDITRIIAFLSVVSVHFFHGSGFYTLPLTGINMHIMVTIRTLSMVCVPLFLLLTGYLTCNKHIELTLRGYLRYAVKLKNVLLTYLFSSIFIHLFCGFYSGAKMKFVDFLKELLGFSQYGWYVEMYIGLFLLSPLLVVFLDNLDRKSLTAVIVVLSVLTVAPSIFNVFTFAPFGSAFSGEPDKILPQWWMNLYPVTYWFIGAYMRKFIDIKKLNIFRLLMLIVIFVTVFSVFCVLKSGGEVFRWGAHCDWGSLQCTVLSVFVFLLINSHDYKKRGKLLTAALPLVSELTFGAYLVSYVYDLFFYTTTRKVDGNPEDYFLMYPIAVAIIATLSLCASFIIHVIVKIIEMLIDKMSTAIKARTAENVCM